MDEGLLQRLTPVTSTGLVSYLTASPRWLRGYYNKPYDLAISHSQVMDLQQPGVLEEFLALDVFFEEDQSLLGCWDPTVIQEMLEGAERTTHELSEDAYKYLQDRFSEIPDRELAEEFGWEFAQPMPLERFEEVPLTDFNLISSDHLPALVADAKTLGVTLYRLPEDPYTYFEELAFEAIDDYLHALETYNVQLSTRSRRRAENHPFSKRYFDVDVDEYITATLMSEFNALNTRYATGRMDLEVLAREVVQVYVCSRHEPHKVSVAAEKIFSDQFSDLNDYVQERWVACAFGQEELVTRLDKEISSRVQERL